MIDFGAGVMGASTHPTEVLTRRTPRRYHVGITSVLRRCVALLGVILCAFVNPSVSASAQSASGPSQGYFRLMEACYLLQQTGDISVVKSLTTVRPLKKLCANCSQWFGEYKTEESATVLKLSYLGQGENLRVSCALSGDHPPMSGEAGVAVRQWVQRFRASHGLQEVKDAPWSMDGCAEGIVPYRITVLYNSENDSREALFFFDGRPRSEHCSGGN